MSAPVEEPARTIDDNPFPSRAAAESQILSDDVLSIRTDAIAEATGYLGSYFDRTGDQGLAIAVYGNVGTGKTHLVYELLRRARQQPAGYHLYIDAVEGDFLNLYRGMLAAQFTKEALVRCIREYYANIVADSLENLDLPSDITKRLRIGDLDPQRFVTRFGLPESTLFAELSRNLTRVPEDEPFGNAFPLLLRDELVDEVWGWLRGENPGPALAERGVEIRIDTESAAIKALGMIAVLYRGRARHFVLAFDQMDRVLPGSSRPAAETRAALLKLVRQMTDQGFFLVLAGMPDFLDAMGLHGREHGVNVLIPTDGLSRGEVRTYIKKSIQRTRYRYGFGPFSPETADYIADLAGNNVRRMIQICHGCYRAALESGDVVTTAMVNEAARRRSELNQSVVRKRIVRELERQGRAYERNHPVDGMDGPRAPYWIPVGDTGCALFVSDSLILAADTAGITREAAAVRGAAPQSRTALVVNGFLSDQARAALEEGFPEPPLVYRPETFAEDFARLIGRMTEQLEAPVEDQVKALRAVGRLSAAQSTTHLQLERLEAQIESIRSSTAQQYTELARSLQRLGSGEGHALLPDHAEHLFAEALGDLRQLTGLETALSDVFGAEPSSIPPGLVLRLQNREIVRAVGVATLADTVVVAFRDAVRGWYHRLEDKRNPTAEQRRRLNSLCRNFEGIVDYLPLTVLSTLADLGADVPSQGAVRFSRTDLVTLLADLGFRVQQALGTSGPH